MVLHYIAIQHTFWARDDPECIKKKNTSARISFESDPIENLKSKNGHSSK